MSLITTLEQNLVFFSVCVAILGLLIGSFLNVVIYRLPVILEKSWSQQCKELLELEDTSSDEGFSLWRPRSRCSSCLALIRGYDNIPIASYLILKGQCRSCNTKIPFRYPFVEFLTGVTFVLLALKFGFGIQCGAALVLTCMLIPLGFIDFDYQILPDNITVTGIWLGLFVNYFEVFTSLHSAFVGAISGYLCLWLVFHAFKLLTGKEGMGYGDFKLLALLGAWLGWQYLPLIILLSAVSGAIIGVLWLMLNRKNRDTPIPFGPFLCIAGWITLVWGDEINGIYLRVSGLG